MLFKGTFFGYFIYCFTRIITESEFFLNADLNLEYSNICKARLSGPSNSYLRLDLKSPSSKFQVKQLANKFCKTDIQSL